MERTKIENFFRESDVAGVKMYGGRKNWCSGRSNAELNGKDAGKW